MTPEQLQQLSEEMMEIRQLAERALAAASAVKELPPHFHRVDRINQRDIAGGFTTMSATPTQVAEEGSLVFYTTGGTYRGAVKLNQTWYTWLLS